ncbi:MAG: DUF1843 domain-containing protein [Erythrobacter sp.]|nr:DUF1843 domain-containing protein [Erythrobacter sp.]
MVIMLYAPAISDALADKNVSLEELRTLRDHALSVIEQQGDLEGAIAKLEAEVRRRGSRA